MNIKKYRQMRGETQLDVANAIGVSRVSYLRYEAGTTEPSLDILNALAVHFGITVDELLGVNPTKQRAKKIPVLGYVKAGIPIEAIEEVLDYEEISEDMARTGEYVGLKICGDSMEPRFKEGDVVIVRIQPDCDSGDIAVVMINGDETTVKKIEKTRAGIKLIPFNSSYDPMFFTNQEIEELPVRLFGRVVELRAKF